MKSLIGKKKQLKADFDFWAKVPYSDWYLYSYTYTEPIYHIHAQNQAKFCLHIYGVMLKQARDVLIKKANYAKYVILMNQILLGNYIPSLT